MGVMPQLGLVAHLICDAHFEPFSIVYECWAFQLRCWLIMSPRYFVVLEGIVTLLGSVSVYR